MKILVYGAGVLGSDLAHVLLRGGNEVVLLARGNRYDEIIEHGLVIRHYLQLRTSTDRITLTNVLGLNDRYDLIFVVVQRSQLDDILPVICQNTGSQNMVFVGNNVTAFETEEYIRTHSQEKKHIAFGFQGSGGRREAGKVISIHTGKSTTGGKMTVGYLNADESLVLLLKQAFILTDYHLNFCENMDAWLKCHAAFVLPIVFACYSADGDLRKVAWDSRRLNQMLNAIDDAYRIVKAAGYPIIPPENEGFLQSDRSKYYWLLKLMAATPIGKLAASNHAMSARKEIRRLYDDFCLLKQKADIETPDWDKMAKNMEKC